ncbi:MAG: hypothetical protein E7162_00940 [Firmicutes bacterium]|nr:hypothetical protein [Bacillota bacterium]
MKQKIMIDMDDVITQGGFLHLINEFLGTNYEMDYFKEFHMQDVLPDKEAFFKWFVTKNMYDYCTLLPGAKETIEELNKYYDVYIGTSYIFRDIPVESSVVLKQKCDYLHKELPFITPFQYIFIYDKSLLDVDIKIDDKPSNLTNCKRNLMFTAWHNEKMTDEELKELGIERVNSWLDIKNKLLNQNK